MGRAKRRLSRLSSSREQGKRSKSLRTIEFSSAKAEMSSQRAIIIAFGLKGERTYFIDTDDEQYMNTNLIVSRKEDNKMTRYYLKTYFVWFTYFDGDNTIEWQFLHKGQPWASSNYEGYVQKYVLANYQNAKIIHKQSMEPDAIYGCRAQVLRTFESLGDKPVVTFSSIDPPKRAPRKRGRRKNNNDASGSTSGGAPGSASGGSRGGDNWSRGGQQSRPQDSRSRDGQSRQHDGQHRQQPDQHRGGKTVDGWTQGGRHVSRQGRQQSDQPHRPTARTTKPDPRDRSWTASYQTDIPCA